jgi:DNA-binding NtrC family response regulator
MIPPRILVIDDLYAKEAHLRGSLCFECGLVKIDAATSDSDLERLAESKKAIAGAVFTSGQISRGSSVENSVEEVLNAVNLGWPAVGGWRWALILLDLQFDSTPARNDDDKFGLKILEELVRRWPDRDAQTGNSEIPIVMLSTVPRKKGARSANEAGADAYVEKEELKRQKLRELLNEHGLIGDQTEKLVGRSHSLLRVLREARRIAQMLSGNAMILGPTGSGKSDLARYIHRQSRRNKEPFVPYVSAASAESLEQTNFFGHWEGAFTGATEHTPGRAEDAHEGILFFDEVHNLTTKAQNELLVFARPNHDGLRLVRRLGSFPKSSNKAAKARDSVRGTLDKNYNILVDVVLLSATNEHLDDPDWRADNGFRDDLYSRLATDYWGNPLRYPSLEERKEDIPILFKHFVEQATRKEGWCINNDGTKSVDAEVYSQLMERSWPSNVAQLHGVAQVVARNSKDFPDVFVRHLPRPDERREMNSASRSANLSPAPSNNSLKEAEQVLRNVEVPRSLSELDGRLVSLRDAYGQLVKRLLESAMEQHKSATRSDNYITPALRTLLSSEITSPAQACDKLLSLSKLFMNDPPKEGSLLEEAIERCRKIRRPAARKVSKGGSD